MFKVVRHKDFQRLALLAALFIVIGTFLFMALEGWSLVDSLYFTVSTILTVGYGDVHVTHDFSKVVAVVYMLLVVPFVLGFIELVAELIHDRILEDVKR